jgi:hypothetical protein
MSTVKKRCIYDKVSTIFKSEVPSFSIPQTVHHRTNHLYNDAYYDIAEMKFLLYNDDHSKVCLFDDAHIAFIVSLHSF